MSKPWVYIASPYTKGDPAINTHFQCRTWNQLMEYGKVWPYAPLWTHFQHTVLPQPYDVWVEYDNAVIDRMDACIRLAAMDASGYFQNESSGADKEVSLFHVQNKPVFYNWHALHLWVEKEWDNG